MRKIDICTNLMYIYYITAKLAIFSTDMLWESCSKFNLEQLSYSMSVANIARLASCSGSQVSLATAKLVIFSTEMLWESCSKLNFKQLSNSMSVANIASLAVARKICDP